MEDMAEQTYCLGRGGGGGGGGGFPPGGEGRFLPSISVSMRNFKMFALPTN